MSTQAQKTLLHVMCFIHVFVYEIYAQKYVTINTPSGSVKGFEVGGVQRFLGLPFAKPPVGDLRFQKPLPHKRWEGVREALKSGPMCMQEFDKDVAELLGMTEEEAKETFPIDEDCLYLDIIVPEAVHTTAEPLSVMVWIHGGALLFGSPTGFGVTTGEVLATKGNVIVVLVAYRLGFLGFPLIDNENIIPNLGFFDQHLALKWVNKNIASFGGNADKVTIFGESAGGWSVGYQTLYSGNAGLFHRAISQSGVAGKILPSLKEMHSENEKVLKSAFGCSEDLVKCLREADAVKLSKSDSGLKIDVTVDGDFITDQPESLFKAGKYNKVPTLFSTTSGTFNQ